MPYASYRCEVRAPLHTTWEALQKYLSDGEGVLKSGSTVSQQLGSLALIESVVIDSDEEGIQVNLEGQGDISGRRSFRLRLTPAGVVMECFLDWQAAQPSLLDTVTGHLEDLVKQPLIRVKSLAEEIA